MLTFHQYKGKGVLNSLIDKLPIELHIPQYHYCGPGTNLSKRLQRGDPGINPLDAACKEHDIAYFKNHSLEDRHKADWILENRAWERVKSKDAKIGEMASAWVVTNAMKLKRKLGMGCHSKRADVAKRSQRKSSSIRSVVKKIDKSLKKALNSTQLSDFSSKNLKKSSLLAIRAGRGAIKKAGGRAKIKIPRVIPFESKSGGFLPLLPLLGALSALGSVAGGASAIAKTITDAKNARKKLEEEHRHNITMEEIGKKGSGLYLRKNSRGGFGLFLKKQKETKNFL